LLKQTDVSADITTPDDMDATDVIAQIDHEIRGRPVADEMDLMERGESAVDDMSDSEEELEGSSDRA
jgi:hypothetical protein